MGDRLGEAKASGNLGNTLKVMGRFDEAVLCCRRHLDISRELTDKVGEHLVVLSNLLMTTQFEQSACLKSSAYAQTGAHQCFFLSFFLFLVRMCSGFM